MNRQYEANDTLAGIWGHHKIRFGADAIVAHNGGNSKEFGGPSYLGVFAYNTCTLALAVCESSTYLDNIANVKTYSQSYGNAATSPSTSACATSYRPSPTRARVSRPARASPIT
jgi:hypothetical protein